jgi:tRNA (guanine37-N1)-methyltransferase
MFDSYLGESILGRAQRERNIAVSLYNLRDYSKDKRKRVDDTPYGGGPGMVMQAQPILQCVTAIKKKIARRKSASKVKVIITSPAGEELTNTYADKVLKGYTDIIFIAGRYEGIDSRVKKVLRATEMSIGDYVLTGGELPIMVAIDVMTRRIPGVLGNLDSIEEKRVSSSEMYTKPDTVEFEGKKYKVPPVLLSGNHKKIEEWKAQTGRQKKGI